MSSPSSVLAAVPPSPIAARGEFARHWPLVVLSMLGVGTSVSGLLLYTFGTLVVPLQQALGWSRADIQLAASCIAAGGAVSINLVGWLNNRFGMRRLSLVTMVLLSLGFLSLTLMQGSVNWLYLAYFLLPFIGIGTTPVTWTQIINLNFERRRGLALALVLCGTGLAAAVMPPLLTWAIGRWDWRAAYLVIAALPLLLMLPIAAWLMPRDLPRAQAVARPAVALPGLSFAQGLRSGKFWICNLALALMVSAIVGMVTNTVPILRDLGLSPAAASSVFSAFGVALIGGRVLVGYLIDRFWAPGVAAVCLALPGIGCLIFLNADAATPIGVLVLATALVGMGSGAEMDIAAYLVSRYFGMRDYGKLFGLHLSLVTVGTAIAPFGFAALLRSTGGYGAMLSVCAACCVLGPLLLPTLGRYPKSFPSHAA